MSDRIQYTRTDGVLRCYGCGSPSGGIHTAHCPELARVAKLTVSESNFSNAPVGIDVAKARRDGKASVQSVRSTLIEALRAIDEGDINPDAVVVCMARKQTADDSNEVFWRYAGGVTTLEALGLLDTTKMVLYQESEYTS